MMEETPPNGHRNQQYKDYVIWEAVRELSQTHIVHFATEDKAFFENHNPGKGLVQSIEECEAEDKDIFAHSSLESFLESLDEAVPPLDYQTIAEAVDIAVIDDLAQIASDKTVRVGPFGRFEDICVLDRKARYVSVKLRTGSSSFTFLAVGRRRRDYRGDASYLGRLLV